MAREEGRQSPHTVILEERSRLRLTGVQDVRSFDEQAVLLETGEGLLMIRGEGLHVERLTLEQEELTVTGRVQLLEYEDEAIERGGFFARLFG